MPPPRRIFLTTLILAVITGFAWLLLRAPSEPVFHGRPLTYWLNAYDDGYIGTNKPAWASANAALADAGPRAIPILLRLLEDRDSPFKRRFIALAQKQHWYKIDPLPYHNSYPMLLTAFVQLGPPATNAIPDLIRICDRGPSRGARITAARILGALGPAATNALPVLLRGIADTNSGMFVMGTEAILRIGADPQTLVPILTTALASPDMVVRMTAAYRLGQFGPAARPAIPALLKTLQDPEPIVQTAATNALRAIDPSALPPFNK